MEKAVSTPKKFVRDPRTGETLEVRGFGALKGQLKIRPGVDLTKPIFEQVMKKTPARVAAHKG